MNVGEGGGGDGGGYLPRKLLIHSSCMLTEKWRRVDFVAKSWAEQGWGQSYRKNTSNANRQLPIL